jgi:transposase
MAERHDSSHEKCEKIPLSEPSLRLLFETLDLSWVEAKVASKYSQRKRRPRLPGTALIRAHLFKDIRQLKSFRKLEKALAEHDGLWAQALGFKNPPHHDSFSAFRSRMGPELFVEIFREIRRRLLELKPDLAEVVAVDSTSVGAHARSGRGNRKSSDPDARWGVCIDPKTGKEKSFFGYKLHTALSAKYGAPVEFRVTPGKCNDSPEYPKLIRALSDANVPFNIVVADKGYDSRSNYFVTLKHQAIPIIAYNRRRKPKGTTGRQLDRNLPIMRHSTEWDQYYKLRGSVERQFSELKEQLGVNDLTLRGMERVTIHLCISLIVLLAINLVAHMTGNPELLRSIEPWRYNDV